MGIPLATQAKRVILPVGGEFDSAGGDEPTAPDAPSAPSLTVGDTQLSASWAAVSGATTYDVIYNTSDSTSGATAFSGNPVSGTSALITGLTNDTAYYVFVRATNAAGSSAYSASATATPTETAAGEYTLIDGVFTLTAPIGVDFGSKPYGDKPFFVALADDDFVPSATLGRFTTWNFQPFNGTLNTDQILTGATKSAFFDLSESSGGAFGQVDLTHEPDSIVINRAVYCDYTHVSAIAARMRYNDVVTVTVAVGQWFKGTTSGAVAQVNRIGPISGTHPSVYMERNVGTIPYPTPDIEFIRDEVMDVFADADVVAFAALKSQSETDALVNFDDTDPDWPTPLGTAVNKENDGIFFTFNHKVCRIWPASGSIYINAYHGTNIDRIGVTLEGVGQGNGQEIGNPATLSATHYDYRWMMDSYSYKWTHETFVHRNSALNTYDGMRLWIADAITMFANVEWRTRTDVYPEKQRRVAMMQVSNGCAPGTVVYQNHLIIDDSEYQVFLFNAAGQRLMLPPITWNAGENGIITAAELPYLPDWTRIEVWVNQVVMASYARAV